MDPFLLCKPDPLPAGPLRGRLTARRASRFWHHNRADYMDLLNLFLYPISKYRKDNGRKMICRLLNMQRLRLISTLTFTMNMLQYTVRDKIEFIRVNIENQEERS
jgi:hypothetical protein